jgi:glycosyltransferase involved in cell wall biosynthesis
MITDKASIVIPALNEAESIAYVISAIPPFCVDEIIVVDGGSTDETVSIAEKAGARVIHEPRRGYGIACYTGLLAARSEIVVFLDAHDDGQHQG